jgi:hypothetical protein
VVPPARLGHLWHRHAKLPRGTLGSLGREIEPACELLQEVGIDDFEPEQLMAIRDSRVFAEFKQVFADYPSEDADDEQLDEYFKRLHTLAIEAGSIAISASGTE